MIEFLTPYFEERNSDVYIVVDPRFPISAPQIDCIYYRQGKIVILELKNIHGRFIPEVDESLSWKSLGPEGKSVPIAKQSKNPFLQVKIQREHLIKYFIEKVLYSSDSKNLEEANVIRANFGAWIVTGEDSEPAKYDNLDKYWSEVLPIGKQLAVKLSMIGTRQESAITEQMFKKFLKNIGAHETTLNDLFLKGVVPEYDPGKVPLIEVWLQSKEEAEKEKAIKYCKELILIRYFDRILELTDHSTGRVRKDALSLLFEWITQFPQKFMGQTDHVVTRAVPDPDWSIRETAYTFLLNGPFRIRGELQKVIEDALLRENTKDLIVLNIRTFAFMDDLEGAANSLKYFYGSKISEAFFFWEKRAYELDREYLASRINYRSLSAEENLKSEKMRSELSEAQRQANYCHDIAVAFMDASLGIRSGELSRVILDHLKRVLAELAPLYHDSSISPTAVESIKALGKIGSSEAADYLRDQLQKAQDSNIILEIIASLGNMHDLKSAEVLRKFLDYRNPSDADYALMIRSFAADALSKLGIRDAFEKIWNLFLETVHEEPPNSYETNLFFKSMLTLERDRLERELWKIIEKEEFSQTSLHLYAEFLKQCGGKYTAAKCSKLLLEGNVSFDGINLRDSPENILGYVIWSINSLEKLGEEIGLRFLSSGRKNLEATGLDLATPYMMGHQEILEKYLTSDNEEVRHQAALIYVKLGDQEKVERSIIYDIERGLEPLFFLLGDMAPRSLFESYYMIRDNLVLDCIIIAGKLGLFTETRVIEGMTLRDEKTLFFPWHGIHSDGTFGVGNVKVGLLLRTEKGAYDTFALISRKNLSWNIIIENEGIDDDGLDAVIERLAVPSESKIKKHEITATQEYLYNILRLAFMEEYTLLDAGQSNEVLNRFSSEIKPEMMIMF